MKLKKTYTLWLSDALSRWLGTITRITNTKRAVWDAIIAASIGILLSVDVKAEQPSYNVNVPIVGREQAAGLKPGAKIAMACAKCKIVQMRDVDKKGAFLDWFTPSKKHTCPGCGGNFKIVFTFRGSRNGDWIHTCSKCGDKSMFCCATEPGKKTEGMQ